MQSLRQECKLKNSLWRRCTAITHMQKLLTQSCGQLNTKAKLKELNFNLKICQFANFLTDFLSNYPTRCSSWSSQKSRARYSVGQKSQINFRSYQIITAHPQRQDKNQAWGIGQLIVKTEYCINIWRSHKESAVKESPLDWADEQYSKEIDGEFQRSSLRWWESYWIEQRLHKLKVRTT